MVFAGVVIRSAFKCYKSKSVSYLLLRAHGKVVIFNKSNTPQKTWGLATKPQKSLDQKLTPKKSLAEFMSLKNFQKTLKWYNTENKVFKNRFGYTLFIHRCMWPGYAGATKQIFRLVWIPKKILT